MCVVYLRSAVADLAWMASYYSKAFPEGAPAARSRHRAAERLIAGNPEIGHSTGVGDSREFPIPRTPFSIIFRLGFERIEILRVWDNWADPDRLRY